MSPPPPLPCSTPCPLRSLPRLALAPSLAVCLFAACARGTPEPDPGPRPDFQPTTTVEELMQAVIDPAADAVWDAVVITSTRDGIDREVPDSDEDWLALEHHAVRLLESGNLLQIQGRPIAAPDSVSELPGIDLEPADIAVRVAGQYDACCGRAASCTTRGWWCWRRRGRVASTRCSSRETVSTRRARAAIPASGTRPTRRRQQGRTHRSRSSPP